MKSEMSVTLALLQAADREQFILDNQEAFLYGATQEFGLRDQHFEEKGEIISQRTIADSIDTGEAYRIFADGEIVGGLVIKIEGERGDLQLLFTKPALHSRGIGQAAWQAVEGLHPEVRVWETVTPYFETRNIHFYVNRCGFHIVEFFCDHHPEPNEPEMNGPGATDEAGGRPDAMFRFEKVMPPR